MDCWKFCLTILLCNNFLKGWKFYTSGLHNSGVCFYDGYIKTWKVSEDINIQTRYTANLCG